MNTFNITKGLLILTLMVFLAGCKKSLDEARMDCLTDASNAPTDTGVRQRVSLCNQKYPAVAKTGANIQGSSSQGGGREVDWSTFKPLGVVVEDHQYGITVTRPIRWFNQSPPSAEIRFMFGFHDDGYVGNCNVNVLNSPSTAGASQEEVDRVENKRKVPNSFFEDAFRRAGYNASVIKVQQIRRGTNAGQLVDYTYQTFSPNLNSEVYYRSELFSHSRPGKVYSITCSIGAETSAAAQIGFDKSLKEFESFAASLKVRGL